MRGPRQRRDGGGRENRTFQKRRTPPPANTGLESAYWQERQREATPVVLSLKDGGTVRGTVAGFDGQMIRVRSVDGPELVVRKADIRYLEEEDV